MSEFKIYSCRPGCQGDLEEEVKKYLEEHPMMTIKDFRLTAEQYHIYLAVFYDTNYAALPMFIDKGQHPQLKPQEVTCDDPWKGEFIPVGDPKVPAVESFIPKTPAPRRNVMEQFGASYH